MHRLSFFMLQADNMIKCCIQHPIVYCRNTEATEIPTVKARDLAIFK